MGGRTSQCDRSQGHSNELHKEPCLSPRVCLRACMHDATLCVAALFCMNMCIRSSAVHEHEAMFERMCAREENTKTK